MKVNKIMKKYIKLSILLAVTSSLQLNCAFNAAKRIGKTVCAIPLTALTVEYARTNSLEKESVAKHEAAHAFHVFIQPLESVILYSVEIKHLAMNRYVGRCRSRSSLNYDCKNQIVCALSGPAQDLYNKNWLERQNFMELELGLPLTRTQKSLSDDLEFIHVNPDHGSDLQYAYKYAYKIAEHEILNDLNDESDAIIQKQIENRVQELLLQGLQEAKTLVQQNQPQINAVAQALCDKEYFERYDVRAIIESCK